MRAFSQFIGNLEQTTDEMERSRLVTAYLSGLDGADKLFVVGVLAGMRFKKVVAFPQLEQWARQEAGLPEWLLAESLNVVREPLELLSMVLRKHPEFEPMPLSELRALIPSLDTASPDRAETLIRDAWKHFDSEERLIFNKMVLGSFRFQLPNRIVCESIASLTGMEVHEVSSILHKKPWQEGGRFDAWFETREGSSVKSTLRPFTRVQMESFEELATNGTDAWFVTRKPKGIRCKLIVKEGNMYLWSEHGELLNDVFPEFQLIAAAFYESLVLEGTIAGYKNRRVLPEESVVRRMNARKPTKALLRDAPAVFVVGDLIEYNNRHALGRVFSKRRQMIEDIVNKVSHPVLRLEEEIEFRSWIELDNHFERLEMEGLEEILLKRKSSKYKPSKTMQDWLIRTSKGLRVRSVLLYVNVQARRQRNAAAELTFALWRGEELLPVARLTVVLNEEEKEQLDAFVAKNATERFGPVRSVKPELVFELEFDAVRESKRHKSGIQLKSPRVVAWLKDEDYRNAGTIAQIRNMV